MNHTVALTILAILGMAQLGATVWVQWKKSKVGSRARAALFQDKDFVAMFDTATNPSRRSARVIERYKPLQDKDSSPVVSNQAGGPPGK